MPVFTDCVVTSPVVVTVAEEKAPFAPLDEMAFTDTEEEPPPLLDAVPLPVAKAMLAFGSKLLFETVTVRRLLVSGVVQMKELVRPGASPRMASSLSVMAPHRRRAEALCPAKAGQVKNTPPRIAPDPGCSATDARNRDSN